MGTNSAVFTRSTSANTVTSRLFAPTAASAAHARAASQQRHVISTRSEQEKQHRVPSRPNAAAHTTRVELHKKVIVPEATQRQTGQPSPAISRVATMKEIEERYRELSNTPRGSKARRFGMSPRITSYPPLPTPDRVEIRSDQKAGVEQLIVTFYSSARKEIPVEDSARVLEPPRNTTRISQRSSLAAAPITVAEEPPRRTRTSERMNSSEFIAPVVVSQEPPRNTRTSQRSSSTTAVSTILIGEAPRDTRTSQRASNIAVPIAEEAPRNTRISQRSSSVAGVPVADAEEPPRSTRTSERMSFIAPVVVSQEPPRNTRTSQRSSSTTAVSTILDAPRNTRASQRASAVAVPVAEEGPRDTRASQRASAVVAEEAPRNTRISQRSSSVAGVPVADAEEPPRSTRTSERMSFIAPVVVSQEPPRSTRTSQRSSSTTAVSTILDAPRNTRASQRASAVAVPVAEEAPRNTRTSQRASAVAVPIAEEAPTKSRASKRVRTESSHTEVDEVVAPSPVLDPSTNTTGRRGRKLKVLPVESDEAAREDCADNTKKGKISHGKRRRQDSPLKEVAESKRPKASRVVKTKNSAKVDDEESLSIAERVARRHAKGGN